MLPSFRAGPGGAGWRGLRTGLVFLSCQRRETLPICQTWPFLLRRQACRVSFKGHRAAAGQPRVSGLMACSSQASAHTMQSTQRA